MRDENQGGVNRDFYIIDGVCEDMDSLEPINFL